MWRRRRCGAMLRLEPMDTGGWGDSRKSKTQSPTDSNRPVQKKAPHVEKKTKIRERMDLITYQIDWDRTNLRGWPVLNRLQIRKEHLIVVGLDGLQPNLCLLGGHKLNLWGADSYLKWFVQKRQRKKKKMEGRQVNKRYSSMKKEQETGKISEPNYIYHKWRRMFSVKTQAKFKKA